MSDQELLSKLRHVIHEKKDLSSYQVIDHPLKPNLEAKKIGQVALAKGKMGTIVLAGGMGTRLHFPYAKGKYPISAVRKKSLFQLIAEKTVAASVLYGVDLNISFMTSPENHKETEEFFKDSNYFGLKKDQITFFEQGEIPFLDEEGNFFESEKGKRAQGPDGNGQVFEYFKKAHLLDLWKSKGIEYINLVLIDNPLADPFDPNLLGELILKDLDILLKCVEKENPLEKTGTAVLKEGKLKVVEYSEMDPEEAKNHKYANISLMALKLSFADKLSQIKLPLHFHFKAAKKYVNGKVIPAKEPVAYKFEAFIFDILDYTNKSDLIVYPREDCFAPLKNQTGPNSPSEVTHQLESYDRKILSRLTGERIVNQPLELEAQFHYPTKKLKDHWRGKVIDMALHYIHEDQ